MYFFSMAALRRAECTNKAAPAPASYIRRRTGTAMENMMATARIAGMVKHSSVDGPGVRFTVFFQGCPHHCPGCHNPETWDPAGGEEISFEDLIEEINNTRYLDGITLSGGDPMMQPSAVIAAADAAHAKGLNVWCYSGWTFEEILEGKAGDTAIEALNHIDVLVDGPFRLELLSKDCIYRGSSNQRLIDVPASLSAGKALEVINI